jgi:hypothetical protein
MRATNIQNYYMNSYQTPFDIKKNKNQVLD